MNTSNTANAQYCIDHGDYFEVIFVDDMTKEDVTTLRQTADDIAVRFKEDEKPLLVLVNISKRTTHNQSLFREKVKLLETDGLRAVVFYGPGQGVIYSLVNTVISSYSSVLPMKYFSNQSQAVGWLRANQ